MVVEKFFVFYPYPILQKRSVHTMCKAILISEAIINRCIDEGYPLNTSKLQKILYFMQKEHLKKYGVPVFDEKIVAWECGPAIKEVSEYYIDGVLGFEEKVEEKLFLKDSHKEVLKIVLDKYGAKTPSEMVSISKEENAWIAVWKDGIGKDKVIAIDSIVPPSDREIALKESDN